MRLQKWTLKCALVGLCGGLLATAALAQPGEEAPDGNAPPAVPAEAPTDATPAGPTTGGAPAAAGPAATPPEMNIPVDYSVSAVLEGRPIEKVQFRGNKKVQTDAILAQLQSIPGTRLNAAKLREDIRALYRSGLFEDVQVYAEGGLERLTLIWELKERRVVRRVRVAGHEEVEFDEIKKVIPIELDVALDLAEVADTRDAIEELYRSKGYFLATVSQEIRDVNDTEADVWFMIEEKNRVEIRSVDFVGNDNIADDELRKIIGTKDATAFSFTGGASYFDERLFSDDLVRIYAYYADQGYVNVRLGTPNIRLSRDQRFMYISIPVTEGPVFDIGEVTFTGDLIGSEERHRAQLKFAVGDQFNRSLVLKAREDIQRVYMDLGYAYANVRPQFNLNMEERKVSVDFEISHGKKVYIERINIRGNDKTRDKVIRREMKIAEGELFSQTGIEVSKARISALGFFGRDQFSEGVSVATSQGTTDELIVIDVQVIERPTGAFQIGAGFSSSEAFIAQMQISESNLFGRGQSVALTGTLSGERQYINFRFVEPRLADTMWWFAFDLYRQSRGISTFARNATGGSLTWGYPLSWEVRAFLTYKLEDVSVSTGTLGFADFGAVRTPVESESVANLFRGGHTSSLRASMSYDSRDDRLFPKSGWNHSVFMEVADTFLGSENKFTRYGGFSRYYRRLYKDFILKLNGELGITTSRDPLGVPITERYLIGGIYDIRGFRLRTLGPLLRVARAGEPGQPLSFLSLGGNMQAIFNSEIEFPLLRSVNISGVVFMDVGNAYNLEDRYCSRNSGDSGGISIKRDPCFSFPDSIIYGSRKSVGFGFRWSPPGIGKLRFEWGIPLDRLPDEDPLVFEFTIGDIF